MAINSEGVQPEWLLFLYMHLIWTRYVETLKISAILASSTI